MILSILIPTIPKRRLMFESLISKLQDQAPGNEVKILFSDEPHLSIGEKRNLLLQKADSEYCAFIDDDDRVCDNYLFLILQALESNPDCCSLNGVITTNGNNPKRFQHSIKYKSYFEHDNVLYRPPNHLNVIRTSIAQQFKFPNKSFGEDTDWAMQICRSGLLKTEAWIEPTLYYYDYITNK